MPAGQLDGDLVAQAVVRAARVLALVGERRADGAGRVVVAGGAAIGGAHWRGRRWHGPVSASRYAYIAPPASPASAADFLRDWLLRAASLVWRTSRSFSRSACMLAILALTATAGPLARPALR